MDQRVVPHGVAVRVVDLLERVDVHQHQRRPVAGRLPLEGTGEGVVQDPAGDQPGERVHVGLLLQRRDQAVLHRGGPDQDHGRHDEHGPDDELVVHRRLDGLEQQLGDPVAHHGGPRHQGDGGPAQV
nr:hypothetical protein [Geodermatophilus obscurus]